VGKSGRRIYRKSYFKEKALIYNATIHKNFQGHMAQFLGISGGIILGH
jgi:hypothetical protein